MNSKNSKTSDHNKLLLNLKDKRELKRSDKYVPFSNLSVYYSWKNIKNSFKKINLKYQVEHGTRNLNYLMGHILYQIIKIILSISSKTLNSD